MDDVRSGNWSEAQAALRVWYATALGRDLHARIATRAEAMLRDLYALHCLQLGGTQLGVDLLAGRALIHRMHVTGDGADGIRSEPTRLPLATRSLDLVVLCHALEFCPDPHGLLREVDRVLALDGHVLTIGFNPWSLFGVRRLVDRARVPWSGHFYGAGRVSDWMGLLGLHVRRRESVWMRPPIERDGLRNALAVCERGLRLLPGAGGVYLILGRKRSVPLIPVPAGRERRGERVRPAGIAPPARREAVPRTTGTRRRRSDRRFEGESA